MMLGILFGLFFLLLFIGMPVAYGMVISAVVTLFFDPSLTGIIIPQKLFTGMDSFSLMAVPFFMLAGTLMEKSGITDILVNWAKSLVGHFKGGLGHATIVTGVVTTLSARRCNRPPASGTAHRSPAPARCPHRAA